MCGIACLDSNWTPAIRPLYRPPKSGGWTISTLPPALQSDERLVWAWNSRQKHSNLDAAAAVNEMVNLLQLNEVIVTPELKREIRQHADREWCERDPSRCPRKPAAYDAEHALKVQMRASVPSGVPTGGCCGGRR